MPKLYSSKQIAKTLKNHGFTLFSQKGSHGKFRKKVDEKVVTAIVPMGKREIPAGTFSSILRQSQLNKEDFE